MLSHKLRQKLRELCAKGFDATPARGNVFDNQADAILQSTDLLVELRPSEEPAQSSEARRGVEGAVESNTADEKLSAETGGEKAADYFNELEDYLIEDGYTSANVVMQTMDKLRKVLPIFRRSSQNQTVSGGVEGAHEGTTADEKGESREPEKLNNAQGSAVEFLDYAIDMVESDCSTGAIVATLKAAKDALAESSLSSPPPKDQDLLEDALPQQNGSGDSSIIGALTMDDVAYLRSLGDRANGATTTSVSRQWFYDFAERLENTLKAEKTR